MNNKEIDKLIKDTLTSNQQSSQTADWDVFSQLLKKAEGFENFDTDISISEKVSSHTVAYNDNHWQLLKERLVKEEGLRKKLFTSKAIESILLLLLLLVFQNYDNNVFDEKIAADIKEAVVYNNGSSSIKSSPNGPLYKNTYPSKGISISDDLLSYAHSVEAYTNPKEDGQIAIITKAIYAKPEETMPILLENEQIAFLPSKSVQNEVHSIFMHDKVLLKKEIPFGDPMNLSIGNLPNVDSKKQKYLTASVSGGLGIAKSGYDPIYKIKGYSTYSSQYGIGLLYSVKNKKYEVQTGVRYSKKKYEPNKLTEIYGNLYSGYREISLDKISYDIVDVPISVKYFFKEGNNTSFFLKAGVNASFSVANKYTVATSTNQPIANAASHVEVTDSKQIDKLSKLSQKEFIPGLLQQSKSHGVLTTIGENSFFTVSAEIGAETKLSKDNALVLGMEYNKYYKVDGIGPNRDRLSALTLNLGLKHTIN